MRGDCADPAGARRTFTNARWAQPGRNPTAHGDRGYPANQFPFAYEDSTDHLTGRADGEGGVAAGVRRIRLMTNNPKKIVGLEGYGIDIVERVPIETEPNETNLKYLQTKREKLGHLLENLELGE